MSDVGILSKLSESLRVKWRERGGPNRIPAAAKPNADTEADQLYLRARVMARGGDAEMAVRLFEEATAIAPQFDAAVEAQAELLDMIGRSEAAQAKYAQARNIRAATRPGPPDRPFAVRQRGNFRSEINAYDTVLRSLKKNALPYIARGNAYLASGKPALALADYDRALKLKPGLLDVQAIKAEALAAMGKYDEALTTIEAVVTARPSDAEALSTRSVVLMGLGRLDDANADLNRQLALLPTSQAAARACIALRLAAYELAFAELDSVIARQPHDPYWRLYQATARLRLGQPPASVQVAEQGAWPAILLALHAGHATEQEVMAQADTDCRRAEAWFQLGAVAVARDPEGAKRHWRQVVDHASPSLIEHAAARNELKRIGA